MDNNSDFGKWIISEMDRLGMKNSELAEISGIPASSLSNWKKTTPKRIGEVSAKVQDAFNQYELGLRENIEKEPDEKLKEVYDQWRATQTVDFKKIEELGRQARENGWQAHGMRAMPKIDSGYIGTPSPVKPKKIYVNSHLLAFCSGMVWSLILFLLLVILE